MLDKQALEKEFNLKAIRSSGSGGQHVNKVATKIELSFSINDSVVLANDQKERIISKLATRLTKDQVLLLQCGDTRSQLKNKGIIIKRAIAILQQALQVDPERKPTKIPRAVIRKRLKNKKHNSDIKANRKKPKIE
ncbi:MULTISPECIES: alternative ribosome rescue aminoacyl-tRNA hydrolase ArfB [unclassified Olleya]|uniref:alternative ribosome rescue aminoacyl-tRNA hydrolase ArfB n=1 Tax=unclassified Olleya TaxID=2615019 RepID=UPI0011A51859|nr:MULTISPECIES: alternative ribosome rescue aminoacyl-tRNA hydrolase ArfB [unclassified Olleya]TVZ47844.1 ribosome-associated protein [Olleya sp. Hel_I_94]